MAPASLVLLLVGTAFALAASGALSYREVPAWGYTLTTASDLVKLVAQLHFKQILTPELCEYALGLMQQVTPTQRWGITAGLSPSASVAVKNGWYPENDGSN